MYDPNGPVVNNLPPTVILVFLPMVIAEGFFAGAEAGLWGQQGIRALALQQYAYFPEVTEQAIQNGSWGLDVFWRFVTFSFININFLGALFAGVMTLALGKFVAEALGEVTFVVTFFATAAFGALIYTLLSGETYPLFGAYPAAFGMLGAFSFVMYTQAGGMASQQMRAFQLLGVLLVLNWIYVLFFGAANTWIAELAAAILGFAIAAARVPGGVDLLLSRLRQR